MKSLVTPTIARSPKVRKRWPAFNMKILSKHTVDFLFCDVVNSIINLLISIRWVAAKVTHIVGVILVFVCFAVSVGSCLDVPYFLGVILFSSVGICFRVVP